MILENTKQKTQSPNKTQSPKRRSLCFENCVLFGLCELCFGLLKNK